MNKKRKILIMLIFFLLISLSGLVLWYLFYYRCNLSITNFESFDGFIASNSCKERKYSVKGILYNIDEKEDDVTFDFNAFDEKHNESIYIENISLPVSSRTELEKVMSNSELMPVNIDIQFTRSSLFEDYTLKSFTISKLEISKEEIADTLKKMYVAIKDNGNIEIPNYDEYSGLPFAQVDIVNDLLGFKTIGYNVYPLYRPLVETSLLNTPLKDEILGEYSSSDITTYLNKVSKFKTTTLDKDKSEEEKTNASKIFPFGCVLAEKLINSENLENEARDIILNEYCNIDELTEKLNSITDSRKSYEYDMNDLIGSINLNRITIDDTSENLSDWNISIISDVSSAERIYNTSLLTDEKKEILQSSLATILVTNNELTLNNVCKIASVSEKDSDIYERIKILFIEGISKGLKLIDSDIHSILWCLEAYKEDEDFNDFYTSILMKLYYTNIQEKKGVYGLWNKNKLTLEGNSKFFSILLDKYEN